MRLASTVLGRGDRVLCLVHGLLLDASCWDGLEATLAPRFVMIRPELPGHGASPLPSSPYDLEELAAALGHCLDREGVGPVTLIGHSIGAMACLRLALADPERVEAMALLSPSAETAGPGKRLRFVFLKSLLPRIGPRPFMLDACARAVFARDWPRTHPEAFGRWSETLANQPSEALTAAFTALATRSELRPRLHELTMPCLVVTGEKDGALHPVEARRLAEGLPRARFCELPGRGHMLPLEAGDLLAAMLSRWLEETASSPKGKS